MKEKVKIRKPVDTVTFTVEGAVKSLQNLLDLLFVTFDTELVSDKPELILANPEGGEPQEEAKISITCVKAKYAEIIDDIKCYFIVEEEGITIK